MSQQHLARISWLLTTASNSLSDFSNPKWSSRFQNHEQNIKYLWNMNVEHLENDKLYYLRCVVEIMNNNYYIKEANTIPFRKCSFGKLIWKICLKLPNSFGYLDRIHFHKSLLIYQYLVTFFHEKVINSSPKELTITDKTQTSLWSQNTNLKV
jgi:hypothetical protein